MRETTTAVLLAMWFAACSAPPLPQPPPPIEAFATCFDVCENFDRLGCEEALPTPGGASCEEVCANTLGAGLPEPDLECEATAPSCEAARRCGARD